MKSRAVAIAVGSITLPGDLALPAAARALVLFAHGSGSSRLSPRNRYVAGVLNEDGLATLLFDLLTPAEDTERAARFDIPLLARRLVAACRWAQRDVQLNRLPVGLFGASTGAAAALIAAAELRDAVRAVVSRGGRPDLAPPEDLERVRAPTRLIVGEWDREVIALNRAAARRLRCEHDLVIVPGATHLFEEPGTLEHVSIAAREWFVRYLPANAATTSSSST